MKERLRFGRPFVNKQFWQWFTLNVYIVKPVCLQLERVPSCPGWLNRMPGVSCVKTSWYYFHGIFFPRKFYLREILRGCRQATILLAWKGTQGMWGGGVLPLCCPSKLTLYAKHEGVTPLRQTFCKQTCLLTIGKGAFMSWLVKSTGVGCVKTSWYYFPGFFVLENFTLWRFYVADASRFY